MGEPLFADPFGFPDDVQASFFRNAGAGKGGNSRRYHLPFFRVLFRLIISSSADVENLLFDRTEAISSK